MTKTTFGNKLTATVGWPPRASMPLFLRPPDPLPFAEWRLLHEWLLVAQLTVNLWALLYTRGSTSVDSRAVQVSALSSQSQSSLSRGGVLLVHLLCSDSVLCPWVHLWVFFFALWDSFSPTSPVVHNMAQQTHGKPYASSLRTVADTFHYSTTQSSECCRASYKRRTCPLFPNERPNFQEPLVRYTQSCRGQKRRSAEDAVKMRGTEIQGSNHMTGWRYRVARR